MPDVVAVGRDLVADAIETILLVREEARWSVDSTATYVEAELGIERAQFDQGMLAMARRAAACEGRYPFDVSTLAVRRHGWWSSSPYTAMLLMTPGSPMRQALGSISSTEEEVLFERITAFAMGGLWGPQSQAVRFGWPSDEGRPQEFSLAVAWLGRRMGIEVGTGYKPPRRKDGGVDVVAWRPFGDKKPGFPILLVQCTLQAAIEVKARDIEVRTWSTWLQMEVDPVGALAVPGTVRAGELWDSISTRVMLFDRCRLAALCGDRGEIQGCSEWTLDSVVRLREVWSIG
jgi:hypothetical protein